jgi:hypothetical protein
MLKAGAAMSNITPMLGVSMPGGFTDRLATDVHDELYSKAIVLDDGETRIALVVCDVIVLESEYVNRARKLIEERCNIPQQNIMISATHTHTGPATASVFSTEKDESYLDFLVTRIADSVQLACGRLTEAQIGIGLGHESRLTFNRRYWMKDGTVRMNPGYNNPDIIRPAGPIDPDVGVIRLIDADGKTVAMLTNFALHYVGGGSGATISADYFAFFADAIQRFRGEEFVSLLANGCCGDINNVDVHNRPVHTKPYERAKHVASMLAAEAFRVSEKVPFTSDCRIAAATEIMDVALRRSSDEELSDAEQIVRGILGTPTREQVLAKERILVSKMPKTMKAEIQVLAINDLAIVALPGEIFVEIGLEIKEASPFKYTFVAELGNGWLGYIPTARAFNEGIKTSYETWLARSSKCVPKTGAQMRDTALRLLNNIHVSK